MKPLLFSHVPAGCVQLVLDGVLTRMLKVCGEKEHSPDVDREGPRHDGALREAGAWSILELHIATAWRLSYAPLHQTRE